MEQNQLVEIVKGSGLPETKGQIILDQFQGYFALAADWEKKAAALVVTDESQVAEMKMAREGRLFLRQKRIAVENTRKELKEQIVREGKAIDGIANVLKALIIPIEDHLDKQEKFIENKRAEEFAIWQREQAEKAEAARVEAERVEAERLAKIEAERVAREKAMEQENARLMAEAAERERLAKIESDRRAREDAARAEAQRVEREKAAAVLRKEAEARAKAEAEKKAAAQREADLRRRAEADRIERERLVALIAAGKAKCPKCGNEFTVCDLNQNGRDNKC